MKLHIESEREVFRGRIIRLVRRRMVLPNGRRTRHDIVEHPGAVAIVPLFANGDVLLLRQYRPTPREELLEIPAGTLEPGETPLATARREIVEETGYRARRWRKIGTFYTAPGFCTEKMHLYTARDLSPAHADADPDEILRPVRMPLEKAADLARRGKIRDAKTIAGLLSCHDGRR